MIIYLLYISKGETGNLNRDYMFLVMWQEGP